MIIGVDTFGCDHARSGIGTYMLSFSSVLSENEDVHFELFGSEIDRFTYTSGKDISFVPVSVQDNLSAERTWHFTSVNKFAQSRKYDLVLYSAPEKVLPISFKVPGIAVVNTVLSSMVEGKKDWIQKIQIKRGLFKVQKIIAASNFIKNDLISHGIDGNKIEVVYNGIDHKLFYPQIQLDEESIDIKPFAIRKPYFIYGSRLSGPEKKHIELIRAFSEFKKKTGLPHRLVICGSDGPHSAEVHKATFDSPYASDIFLTGYFPHESFPLLYSGSQGLIFPAVNEGVGLPVLEAMATGVPVACASSGVLPEIAGDAALFFDPDNLADFVKVFEKLASEPLLCAGMIQKGLERAKLFNWESTVSKTIEIAKTLVK